MPPLLLGHRGARSFRRIPENTLASFELDPHTGKLGRLTVWSSTQVPYYLQHKLSLVLEMPMAQIESAPT